METTGVEAGAGVYIKYHLLYGNEVYTICPNPRRDEGPDLAGVTTWHGVVIFYHSCVSYLVYT